MTKIPKKMIISRISLLLLAFLFAIGWYYYPAIMPVKASAAKQIKGGGLPPGCTCHSKNPRLKSMHGLFSVADCKKCHDDSGNLTKKKSKKMTPARRQALERRMRTEAICKECHEKGKVVAAKKSPISGRFFCPVDQKMYTKKEAEKRGKKLYCPKHSVELINIDEIASKSAKQPKNEYCIACHPSNRKLQKKHDKVLKSSPDISAKNCLKCHKSHSKCGGCHF